MGFSVWELFATVITEKSDVTKAWVRAAKAIANSRSWSKAAGDPNAIHALLFVFAPNSGSVA